MRCAEVEEGFRVLAGEPSESETEVGSTPDKNKKQKTKKVGSIRRESAERCREQKPLKV